MKKLYLLLILFGLCFKGYSQALSAYGFTAFTGTYTALTGATTAPVTAGTIVDDAYSNTISIGFNFVYCGTTYSSLSINWNGFVTLGEIFTTTGGYWVNDLSNGQLEDAPRPILAAYWTDLYYSSSTHISYITSGTAPNRTFTVQWDNAGFYSIATPRESAQLILYETSNIIDFVYSFISTGAYSGGNCAIGITGGSGAAPAGTQPYWSLNNTGASPTPSMTVESRSLTGQPATNQVYRWSAQCTGTPTAGTTIATRTAGCASYLDTLSLSGSTIATGLTYQWQSSPDGSSWTPITGATNATYVTTVTGTIYYECIVTCSFSTSSSTSTPIELFLNTPPAAITGPSIVCISSAITLSDITTGGTWSSSPTTRATVGSSSGVVTGVLAGPATITYTLPSGCTATAIVTVVTSPASITGTLTVCSGAATTLGDATPGGSWSSTNLPVATVGTSSGIVSGVAAGTATISYSLGSCYTTAVVTVNASPPGVTGPSAVCVGSAISLSDSITGGAWTSSSTATATVTATGVVTGAAGGLVAITYTLPGGCFATKTITVNNLPGTIAGAGSGVCVGACVPLFDGTSGGAWSSSGPAIATINTSTGVACGITAGPVTITYTLPTGCFTTTTLVVNPLPAGITGPTSVCEGGTATLSDATGGGTWISTSPAIASIDGSSGFYTGGVTAGATTISYILLTTSCIATTTVTVTPPPPVIIGPVSVCSGGAMTLTDLPGGTWSSSNPTVASIGLTSGIVTGGAVVGTSFVTITYTSPSGCSTSETIAVYPLPPAISGTLHVCMGQTAVLSDGIPGGTWTSGNAAVATVGSGTGIVYGVLSGTDTITYTIGTGCPTHVVVTVNTAPGPIAGPHTVCVGQTILLTDTSAGGTWTSSATGIASAGLTTGIVGGVAAGAATITYSEGGACVVIYPVTVNPLPSAFTVTGGGAFCTGGVGVHIGTSGSTPGISYQLYVGGIPSGAPLPGTGSPLDFGLETAAGSYTVIATNTVTGCSRVMTGSVAITINPLPHVYNVTGGGVFCLTGPGVHVGLDSSDAGVRYQLYFGAVAAGSPITSAGGAIDFGSETSVGTYTVVATNPATGCSMTMSGSATVSTNPLPSLFTVTASGSSSYCAGGTGVHILLSGSSPGVSYQLYNGLSATGLPIPGTGGPLDFGLHTVAGTYTVSATIIATGCSRTMTSGVTIIINPLPTISGGTAVCVGASITLTATPAGGTWSSSNPGNATVGSGSGIVTGLTTGASVTITYTSLTGCTATTTVNVSPSPGPIIGPTTLCLGASAADSDVVPGGLWTSSNTARATIGSLSGSVTGVGTGAVTITYSLGSGCTVTKTMTVTAAPGTIGGPGQVCSGATITLTDATGGGTWSSTPATIATVNVSTGALLGRTAGAAIVTYTVGGCTATASITVNFAPGAISGPPTVCAGSTITLTDSITGGTWTSSNTAAAPIGATTGTITGINPGGTATITYSLGGACVATKIITVNSISPIAGATGICVGATTLLTDAAPGGTWSSSSTAVAMTGSLSGIVTGVSPGITTITYTTSAGCIANVTVTVSTAPLPITGVFTVCAGGSTTTLSDPVGGGIWTSSNPVAATIGSSSGIVTGGAPGSTIITYSLGSGCTKTTTVNVTPLPTVTVTSTHVCSGSTAVVGTPSPSGGTWRSGDTTIATVNATTGAVTGRTPGIVTIAYTTGTGCSRNITITINPLPSPISGATAVCEGATTELSDGSTGGAWSSSSPAIASVAAGLVTGGRTAGTATVSYTLGSGCSVSVLITVVSPPPAIGGALSVCAGQTAFLTDSATGGTWSSVNAAVATVVPGTGQVFGVSSGTALIFYTVGTGCAVPATIIVNPLSPIIGDNVVCRGQTIVLTDTTDDGIWTSSAPAIASIVSTSPTTGLLYGVSAGTTAVITYTLPTGCKATLPVTVNAAPPSIAGTLTVCVGFTTLLSDPAGTGSWSSSDAGIASVDASGVVWGISDGIATITFANTTTSCPATINVTVNPLPGPISAPANVCIGSMVDLTDSPTRGTWTSSDATIATAGLTTGHVGGVLFGTVTITYELSTGCSITTSLNVDALPSPITGNLSVCVGSATPLSDATPGGIWVSSNPIAAPVGATGVVTGLTSGVIVPEHYVISATGCVATAMVTVDALPSAISPTTPALCPGAALALTDFSSGGTWMSSDNTIATIDSSTGSTLGTGPGSATITYTIGIGCIATTTVFVNAAPDPIAGSAAICNSTVVTLTDGSTGGAWTSSNTTVATVDSSGNVTGVALGTSSISYTVAGCPAILNVTVNPHPDLINGPTQMCQGSAIILSDTVAGGTWISSDITIANVDATTGVLTGLTPGTVTVTYSLGTGCITSTNITVNEVPAIPVSPASGILEVCKYASLVLFDATPGGTWSSGSITIATVGSATGIVAGVAAGTSSILYTLSTGCFSTAILTVNTAPSPITGSANICFGTPNTYIDTVTGGAWSSSAPAVATIDPLSGIATGLTLGSATISYVFGACTVTKSVNVYPLPAVFNVSGGGSYCAGGAGVPIGLDNSVTGVNYVLYRGLAATGTFAGTGAALDFGLQTVAGTYTVEAISTATTCSRIMSGSALVTIMPSVPPSVSINAAPGDTVCAGTSATFTAIPVFGGTPTYQWNVNGTSVSTGASYTFVPANGDVVSVTMTSTGGCAVPAVVTHSVTMTVNPFNHPGVNISVDPGNMVCQGTLVTFAAEPAFGGTTPVYIWVKNGTALGAGDTYSYVPGDGDSIRCIMISNYPCSLGGDTVSSAEDVMNVSSPTVPVVTINSSPGTSIGRNQYDTLRAVVANGGVSPMYQWYVNGYPVTGATSDTYVSNTFEITREDSVSCIVTSDALCPGTSYMWVYINASNVGVKQLASGGSDINVIPNPNKGEFIITGSLAITTDQEVSLELTDMLGQIMYRNKVMTQNGRISERIQLSKSPANGMYILSVRTDNENKIFHIVVEQ